MKKSAYFYFIYILAVLAVGIFCIKTCSGQTAPSLYYDFDQAAPGTPVVGVGNLAPIFGPPLTVAGPANGIVAKYLTIPDNSFTRMDGGSVQPVGGATIQMWIRGNYNFAAGRNTNLWSWSNMSADLSYPNLSFYTEVQSGASQSSNNFIIVLDGIGRKSWGWLNDSAWHHLAFVYNAATGQKQVWIDGQCPAAFTINTPTGTLVTGAPQLQLNATVDYIKYRGDIDEVALYTAALDPRQIYQNYLTSKAGGHYTTVFAASVPAAQSVTGVLPASDYAPGTNIGSVPVTTGVNVTPIQQLQSFPLPRYKRVNHLLPMYNNGDPIYEGQRFEPGISDAQSVINDTTVQKELATNYNYMIEIGPYSNAWQTAEGALSNRLTQYKNSSVTLRAQINPPLVASQTLTNDKYLQNNGGAIIDGYGNVTAGFKHWRGVIDESFYTADGNWQKGNIQAVVNTQTNRPANHKLDFFFEDGEEIYTVSNNALNTDPRVRDSVTASGENLQTFYGRRFMRVETIPYRDVTFTIPGLANCIYAYYNLDGDPYGLIPNGPVNDLTLPDRFMWSQARKIGTQINGTYYSTPSMYMIKPSLWPFKSGGLSVNGHIQLFQGWKYLQDARTTELSLGDKWFQPFVGAGWFGDETQNVRPAQWLGWMKLYGVLGAEFYYSSYFTLDGAASKNYSPNWIWQMAVPCYAQAITSRYEDIFRNGDLLVGDRPADYTSNTPGWQYYAGDARAVISIRKRSGSNKYIISGVLNPFSNVADTLCVSKNLYITLAGQSLLLNIRKQGSVYYYDNTVSPVIFYQLDGWHESTHPSYWSANFDLQAELFDTASAGVSIKTFRPNTAAGDFRNFTASIRFAGTDSAEWDFQPRTAATQYLYVRAKSIDGTSTGFNQRMDGAGLKTIDCITDTNWVWYRYNTADAVAITYTGLTAVKHSLRITALNNKLSIERIFVSTDNNLFPAVAIPCGAPTATITPSGATSFCQGGSVTLTANSANSWSWSTGASTQSINVAVSGTYTVTITVTGLGTASASQSVTVFPLPTATVTPSGPTTFCTGNSVTLTSNAQTSYLWSTGVTTQAITVSTSGTYTTTVTDANGCTRSSAPVTVTVTPGPVAVITAGGTISFCQGGNVLLSCTIGAGYSFQWKNAAVNIGGATNSTYSANASGTYTCAVTVTGCTATSNTITVTVNALPTAVITAGGATTFCAGGSVTLTVTANSFYLWSTGATTQAITVSTSGTYTTTVTGANGCTKVSAPVTVMVNPAPTASISAIGGTTFCTGGSVSLAAVTGVGYAYQWRRNAGNLGGATNSNYTATISGNYTVVVTLTGCSATSNTIAVTAVPNPTTANAGPDQSVCTTSTIMNGNAPVNGNGTWTLILGAGTITTPSSPNTTITALGAGGNIFRWQITNAPCIASSDNVTITQNVSSPVSVIITADTNPFCAGTTVTFTAVPTNGGVTSFQWKLNGGNVGLDQNTYSGVFVNNDQVQCVVTSSLGCVTGNPATSNTITLTLSAVSASITAGGPITFCSGGSVTLNANTGAGLTYEWHDGSGVIAGAVSSSYSTGTAQTYFCVVTNAAGCSATSNSIVVTVNANATATITPSGATTFCSGGSVTLTASVNTSYLWSTGATTQAITVSTSGTYTTTVTNASGCTGVSLPVTVTVNPKPTVTIAPANDTTLCQGTVTYSVNVTAGATYQWYKDGSVIIAAVNSNYVVTATGDYYAIVTTGAGCTRSSDTVTVTMSGPPAATITPSGSTNLCTGDSVLLTSSAGNAYLWSTGKTTQSIYAKNAGGYIVTVTGSNGCTASSASTIITITAAPAAIITPGGPTTFCLGGSVVLSSSSATSYLWSTGETTQAITVSTNGTYTTTVTGATGCTRVSGGFTVTVNDCNNCTIPGNLSTTRILWWSANLNWDPFHVATDYIVELVNLRTNRTVPTTWQGHTHTIQAYFLYPSTGYKWRIQAVCGVTNFTPFSEWVYFKTPPIFGK